MEELKMECIKRLEILNLDSKIIKDFKDNDKVYVSKINDKGTEVIQDNNIMDIIKNFEEKKTIKIYHVIIFEHQMYMLAVHSHKEMWKQERAYLRKGWTTIVSFDVANGIIAFNSRDVGILTENGRIKRVVMWKTE